MTGNIYFKVKCNSCSRIFAEMHEFQMKLTEDGDLIHYFSKYDSESVYRQAFVCRCKRSGVVNGMTVNCEFLPRDKQ